MFAAVDEDRHRAVIDQGHFHMSLELSRFGLDALFPEKGPLPFHKSRFASSGGADWVK